MNQFSAAWPRSQRQPDIPAPAPASSSLTQAEGRDGVWSQEQALVEIVRGRLEGSGPVTATALATPLGLEADAVRPALMALEVEGSVLRGRFIQGVNDEQWCDRRLLARIHHYTVQRLRAEIEPVAASDFLRFLFAWQHVSGETRLEGQSALPAALAALEGFEAPANAWETEILPARVANYEPAWLDAQCLSGQHTWARLAPPRPANGVNGGRASRAPNGGETPPLRATTPVRSTPIVVVERRNVALWRSLVGSAGEVQLSPPAQAVYDWLGKRGALFFEELAESARLLRSQAEDALAELVALGLVSSDSFGGLRALLVPSAQRRPVANVKRRGRVLPFGMESAGRWSLIRREPADASGQQASADSVEHVARTLLRRYGLVFWRLLTREAEWLPPWRDLLRVYRRLEARGEIRGGRFVAGFSGEQFALPEAVGLLRQTRRRPSAGHWVSLSGADPLNLVGILTPGTRLAALTGNRLVYRDGVPVAVLAGGNVQFLVDIDAVTQWEAQNKLLRSAAPALMADLA
jgi:ATP-dependent Lhr-like helicase